MANLTDTILEIASELMHKYGISSVTMDDIAKECHISKRTLYEKIPDKRTLVWYCMLYNKEKNQQAIKDLVNESSSTLDALLLIYRHMRNGVTNESSIFFKDMHRLYPDLEKKCREMHQEEAQSFGNFLQKGINEGMFLSNIDLSLAAQAFIFQSGAIMRYLGTTKDMLTVRKMMDTTFVVFLRGIATTKGIKIIDQFIIENNL